MTTFRNPLILASLSLFLGAVPGISWTGSPYAPEVTQGWGGGGFSADDLRDAWDKSGLSERDIRNMVREGFRAVSAYSGRNISNFSDLQALAAEMGVGFSPKFKLQITALYSQQIDKENDRCGKLPTEFHVTCLRDRLGEVARALPESGDYAPMREALTQAVDRLGAVASQNAETGAPTRQFHFKDRKGEVTATGALVPLEQAAIPSAHAQAIQILEQTQTILLRSAENSRKRAVHFERISDTLDSSKVLLRSA